MGRAKRLGRVAYGRVGLSEVDQLLVGLAHPLRSEIEQLREDILAVDPSIQEGIKWNSMSFRTTEWFATLNTRALDRLEFVFHLGAKVRDVGIRAAIPDISGHVTWKSHDRCLVAFRTAEDIVANREQFVAFVREWIKHV